MTFRKKTAIAALGLAIAGAGAAPLPAEANGVAEHYKDKTITILVPYGPGGTYDNAPLGRSKNVTMYHLGSKDPAKIGSWLARLARVADAADIDIEITRSYPMAEAGQAQQELLETDIGRVVVTV